MGKQETWTAIFSLGIELGWRLPALTPASSSSASVWTAVPAVSGVAFTAQWGCWGISIYPQKMQARQPARGGDHGPGDLGLAPGPTLAVCP